MLVGTAALFEPLPLPLPLPLLLTDLLLGDFPLALQVKVHGDRLPFLFALSLALTPALSPLRFDLGGGLWLGGDAVQGQESVELHLRQREA